MEAYNFDDMLEVLYDVRDSKNREVAWKQHKLVTQKFAHSYKRLNHPKAQRVFDCGGFLQFRRYDNNNSLKLNSANFCQTRLCPTCLWRRAKKIFAQVSRVIDTLEENKDLNLDYLFLTLTCKNVSGDQLIPQIDKLFLAFKKLCLRKKFKDAVLGYFRTLEISYNWQTNSYHPHFHVILAVDEHYFSRDKNLYITQEEFCLMWQECMGVDYKPIVDIRTLKDSEKGLGKEIAEVAKYTIKPALILADIRAVEPYSDEILEAAKRFTEERTDEIVSTLDEALAYRRLTAFGGILKQTHRQLNLDDAENGSLVYTGTEKEINSQPYKLENYRWDYKVRNFVLM